MIRALAAQAVRGFSKTSGFISMRTNWRPGALELAADHAAGMSGPQTM